MGRRKKNKNEEVDEAESRVGEIRRNLAGDAKRSAAAVVLFAVALISGLGFFSASGALGDFINRLISLSIGYAKFVFPIFLISSGVVLLLRKETSFYVLKLIGFFVILLSVTGFLHWFYDNNKMLKAAAAGKGGGYLGYALAHGLGVYTGNAGSFVLILSLFFLGIIVAFNFSIVAFLSRLRKEKAEKAQTSEAKSGETEASQTQESVESPAEIPAEPKLETDQKDRTEGAMEEEAEKNIGRIEFVEGPDRFARPEPEEEIDDEDDPIDLGSGNAGSVAIASARSVRSKKRSKSAKWMYPPADMLEESFGTAKGGDIEKNFEIIEKTLKDFGIVVERGSAKTGPAVTQYTFRPAVGVKISKILALQNDLALALAAHPIRIEAPIPGQSLIGIEIPNNVRVTVRLREMVDERDFRRRTSNLTLALGEDVSGSRVFGDLAKMPHLMIAGATGTGKSVCINSIITSLLYQNSPDELKLIMVDPKRVELSLYNGIPHLLTDVVVENSKVVNALKWAVGEMERRYRLLQDTGSRDITSYREKMQKGETIKKTDPETNEIYEEELKNLPYIVILIDELADLMGSHGKEVEGAIVRLAQMARAVGIHLIVSTQRPSVEVITGLIKANITTRIAFQVATQIDSRTIIDMGGAEKLLGNGDMLYLSSSSPKPKRIQAVFVSESEVKRVVKFIKDQKDRYEDEEEPDITKSGQKEILEYKEADAEGGDDDMLQAAKDEILRAKKASASLLQRRLRVGYARAARILDILEDQGFIGPADGAKPREVFGLSQENAPAYENAAEDQEKRDKWQI